MNHSPVLINPRSQEKKRKKRGERGKSERKKKKREEREGERIHSERDEPRVMGVHLANTSLIHIHVRNLLRES